MKILFITEMFPTKIHRYSGIFIFELLKRLRQISEIVVINPKPWFPFSLSNKFLQYQAIPSHEEIDQIPVYHPRHLILPRFNRTFFAAFTLFFSALSALKAKLKHFEFDLVCGTTTCPTGFAAILIGKLYNKPVVVNVRGSDINEYTKHFFLKRMVLFTLKRADFILTTSDALRDNVISFGLRESKVKTIFNGVDLGKFKPIDKSIVRSSFGFSNDLKIVVFVGNLIKIKGVTHLIYAVKQLINKISSLKVIIIGDGDLSTTLKNLVKKLKIENCVEFLGQVDHDTIPSYIGVSDILVLPSLSEGMPNVLKEALACGVPVVATEVGGVPEFIISNQLGLLVPPADVDSLSKAIEIALNQSWDKRQLFAHAQKFTWEKTAQHYNQVFAQLLKKESSTRASF